MVGNYFTASLLPPPWSLPRYSGNMALRNIKYRKLRNIKYRKPRNMNSENSQNTEDQVQSIASLCQNENDKKQNTVCFPHQYEIENGKSVAFLLI